LIVWIIVKDEYYKLPNMVETQKKIAKVVALRNCKGTSEIKKIEKDILFDLAGLSGEEFEMQFGKSSSDY